MENILEYLNDELIVSNIYDNIQYDQCVLLSKYICEKKGITPKQVSFMFNNGICLSNSDIIQGARELFGEEFYLNSIINIARLN